MTDANEELETLRLARAWKAGKLRPVHPTIGRRLNRALVSAGEPAVPFRRATNPAAPSLTDLIRAEYERAGRVQNADISGRRAA